MGWWLVASQEALGSYVIGSIRNMAMAVVADVDLVRLSSGPLATTTQ